MHSRTVSATDQPAWSADRLDGLFGGPGDGYTQVAGVMGHTPVFFLSHLTKELPKELQNSRG